MTRWSFRTQLVLAMLVVVVPLALYAIAVVVLLQREERGAVERGLLETARALASAVDREVAATLTATEILAGLRSLRTGDLRRFYEEAAHAHARNPRWRSVFVVDASGQEVLSLLRPFGAPLPQIHEDPDITHVLATRRAYISGLRTGQVSRRHVIRVLVPVTRDQELAYIVATTLGPEAFGTILAEQEVVGEGAVSVLDRDGIIVARTRDPERWVGQRPSPEFLALFRGDEGVYEWVTLEGIPVYGAYARAPKSGLVANIAVPISTATAPARRSLWLLLFGGVVAVAGGLGLGTLLARWLSRPVTAVSRAVTALGRGEPLPALPPMAVSELAGVQQALERAAQALAERQSESERRRVAEQARVQAESEARRLQRLQRVADVALRDLGQREALQELAENVRDALEADTASILLVAADTGELIVQAASGRRADLRGTEGRPVPLGATIEDHIRTSPSGLVIDDLRKVEAARASVPEGVSALAGVPLQAQGRFLGVLHIGATAPGAFSHDDLALLQVIGGRVVLALERASLLAGERAARMEADLLAELARELNSPLEVDAVLRRIAVGARDVCDSDIVRIAVRDGRSDAMRYRQVLGTRAEVHEHLILEPTRGLVGEVLRTGHPLRTADAPNDPPVHPEYGRRFIEAEGVHTAMVVPIRAGRRLEGLIYLARRSERPYTERDEHICVRLADHASVALRNSRLYEVERTARENAESASRAKDEFLAMLGHELRNPLATITTAVAVLEKVGGDDPVVAHTREVIARQASHLTALVGDLLDVSRVTSGKISLHWRPLDLADAVQRCLHTLQQSGRTAHHRVELVQTDPVWVHADETRIDQILTNLVDNAVKYTPAGGRIMVAIVGHAGQAVVEVADTGVGIAAELLPRVFDLFSQGDQTLDRAQGGLGLGLALVRRLVELHGGSVGVASEGPGRGATFTVRFPRIEPAPQPAPPVSPRRAAGPRRVLIVEDNEDGRDLLRTLLTLGGHEVHEAHDGPSGLAMAMAVTPDVAIIDIGLPGLDGYEVARRLRAAANGRTIRLIALTGYGQDDDRRRALDAGFDVHLVKPVAPETLHAVLDS